MKSSNVSEINKISQQHELETEISVNEKSPLQQTIKLKKNNIEPRRITERNKIQHEIKRLQSYIDIDICTIERLRQQPLGYNHTIKHIEKLKEKNIERQVNIDKLLEREKDLNNGMLDKELSNNEEQNKKDIQRKENIKIEKKKQKNDENIKAKERLKKHYDIVRQSDQKDKQLNREIDRAYKYYLRTTDFIPDYIIKKLKEMPNNKGYIWRSMQLYGYLPSDSNIVTLFEKNKELLIIHEWTHKDYKIWHKKDKGRKYLFYISDINRKTMDNPNILDFIKT